MNWKSQTSRKLRKFLIMQVWTSVQIDLWLITDHISHHTADFLFAGVRSKAALSKHTMMSPPPQPRGKHTPLQHVTATDAQIVLNINFHSAASDKV